MAFEKVKGSGGPSISVECVGFDECKHFVAFGSNCRFYDWNGDRNICKSLEGAEEAVREAWLRNELYTAEEVE